MKKNVLERPAVKRKYEIVLRMVNAIREGKLLSEFCAAEGIGRDTALAHLNELRAYEVKGLNPFLPDLEPGEKYTFLQKELALTLIHEYVSKGGRLGDEALVLADIVYQLIRRICPGR